jgi:hypothetical protein
MLPFFSSGRFPASPIEARTQPTPAGSRLGPRVPTGCPNRRWGLHEPGTYSGTTATAPHSRCQPPPVQGCMAAKKKRIAPLLWQPGYLPILD